MYLLRMKSFLVYRAYFSIQPSATYLSDEDDDDVIAPSDILL